PIVRPCERELFAYEALMRSTEPLLPHPGAILSAAERLGYVPVLGRIVRAFVASAVGKTPGSVEFFVNLHPTELRDDDLYSAAAPLTKVANRVVLEITERASLDAAGDAASDVAARVDALRRLGFRIAIDDLGAGYAGLSSFAQLK